MKRIAIALTAAGVLATGSALADESRRMDRSFGPADARATIAALERRDDALQRESMGAMRIGAVERREIAEQRELIDDLIDRLERGDPVDRFAIDRAFGYPYQSGPHHHGYHDHHARG